MHLSSGGREERRNGPGSGGRMREVFGGLQQFLSGLERGDRVRSEAKIAHPTEDAVP